MNSKKSKASAQVGREPEATYVVKGAAPNQEQYGYVPKIPGNNHPVPPQPQYEPQPDLRPPQQFVAANHQHMKTQRIQFQEFEYVPKFPQTPPLHYLPARMKTITLTWGQFYTI